MKDSAEPLEELGAAVNALIRARGCDEVEVRLPRTRRWDPLIDRVVSRPEVGYDDSAMAKALDRRVGEAEIAELFEHPASQHFTADDF